MICNAESFFVKIFPMDNLLITMDYSWLHSSPVVNELKVKENALIPLKAWLDVTQCFFFFFAVFCKIGALERNAYWFRV